MFGEEEPTQPQPTMETPSFCIVVNSEGFVEADDEQRSHLFTEEAALAFAEKLSRENPGENFYVMKQAWCAVSRELVLTETYKAE